jgi:hypothetical protein
MNLQKIILQFFVIFILTIGSQDICHADFNDMSKAFRRFIETKINPMIWQVHDKIVETIIDLTTPEKPTLPDHRLLDMSSKFIDNLHDGPIFVISGRIKFSYDQKVDTLQITARLFTSGEKLLQKKNVYCGNLISDKDLTTMDIDTIQEKLERATNSDLIVSKGEIRPFMVVFSELSKDQVEQFLIEIESLQSDENGMSRP